jgi:hypothetical protein
VVQVVSVVLVAVAEVLLHLLMLEAQLLLDKEQLVVVA